MLQVQAISTRTYCLGDNFEGFLKESLQGVLQEGDILAVTSKVVSLSENRVIQKSNIDKKKLIQEEADHYLGEIGYGCHLTIKEGLLVPSAGVDESNAEREFYILYPLDPFQSAKRIHSFLKQVFPIRNVGVLLTDSRTMPLRRGVLGVALAYYGFKGVQSKIGEEDLFGRKLKMTQVNVADALATAAVLTMGEGGESCPLALLKTEVEFMESSSNQELQIPLDEDLYKPFLKRVLKD